MDLLDENRKSCCTWNWLVVYGNHVCHSTVHWLSINNSIIKNNYLVFKQNKKTMVKYADEQMDFGR